MFLENGGDSEECDIELSVGVTIPSTRMIVASVDLYSGGFSSIVDVASDPVDGSFCPVPSSGPSASVPVQCTTPGGITFNYEASVSIFTTGTVLARSSIVISRP